MTTDTTQSNNEKNRQTVSEAKPVDKDKKSISLVLINPKDKTQAFMVKRPDDPTDVFCNCWGLPAATLGEGENVEQAIERIGSVKLGLILTPIEMILSGEANRVTHNQSMELWLVKAKGQLKMKHTGQPDVTYYVDWKWGTPADLETSEALGLLGCKLYRDWSGVNKDINKDTAKEKEKQTS